MKVFILQLAVYPPRRLMPVPGLAWEASRRRSGDGWNGGIRLTDSPYPRHATQAERGRQVWGLEEREEMDWDTMGSQVQLVRVWITDELDSGGHQPHLHLVVAEQSWEGCTPGSREGEWPVTSTSKYY